MRKFASIFLAVVLMLCFASTVLAIFPEFEDDGKIFWKGQMVDRISLTNAELDEALGYKAARERAAVMNALDFDASALMLPNVETLYGHTIDNSIKSNRNDFLSDLAFIIQEQDAENATADDPADYPPKAGFARLFNYHKERWLELGFEEDGAESRIHYSYLPNGGVPPAKRGHPVTDLDAPSVLPIYFWMELGAKELPEVAINIVHQDTTNDYSSTRGDNGGWPGALVRPLHVTNPNAYWTLGGSHQANVIVDPTTGRWVMVGRGTDDDRSPSIAMLYAMKALKDSGVPLRRRVRLILGQTEDGGSSWNTSYFGGSGSFSDMKWYTAQDEWPVIGVAADAGVLPINTMNSQTTWSPNIRLTWTDNASTGIGLRFPNVLDYKDVYGTGSISNQMIHGSAANGGVPIALPALLYNQVREEHVYKSYFAGETAMTSSGQNLLQAAWLVMPNGQSAADLASAARALRDSYRINWGGWEFPDEKGLRPPVTKVPMADRWETGIAIEQVDSATGNYSITGDAVQIVTKGHVTRLWHKEFFSPRHILVDFLSKLVIPSGFSAAWQPEMRKLIAFFPFDNFRERKIWNGNSMLGNYAPKVYSGTLVNISGLTPVYNSTAPAPTSWTPKYATAARAYSFRGRNDENINTLDAAYAFAYGNVPTPNDGDGYLNVRTSAATISNAIRERCNDLGLNLTTTTTAANHTSFGYCTPDSDVLIKSMRSYNTYYRTFGVLDSGYTGEIMENKPDSVAGGTYASSFVVQGTPQDGRMIGIGGWGGHGTLHGWNERIELDGIIDHAKRIARTFAEFAGGVPHTWTVSGNGSTAATQKDRLAYINTYGKTAPNIYIPEESVVRPVIAKLYSTNTLPRNESTEILYARKFRMDGLTGTSPAMTLTTNLTNADGTNSGMGKIYMFAKVGSAEDINANWDQVDVGTNGSASFVFAANGIYDQTPAASADIVEVSVIALAVTNGYSVPLDAAGELEEEEEEAKKTVRKAIEDRIDKRTGCNAGFAIFALLAIPFVVRRRK
ncbi:MAG: M20/M25/M40 family metallo-hydrolase [Synergistaceae bacterium]|nr:M20/M25/M40 family metallo-hydrolase [Synergistaceae bacterium]